MRSGEHTSSRARGDAESAALPLVAQLSSQLAAPLGSDETLRLLQTQADLQYHASPVRGIFNSPAATGMGFWSINPYVGCAFGCAYCYARDTHRWALERAGADGVRVAESMPPWLAFERRILVKENADVRLRGALRSSCAPSPGQSVVIGTATDPYQPAERRFGITRRILETLGETRGLKVVIITKSPLVTRDIDLLARLGTRGSLSVHVSLITVDRELARRLEPRAPTPQARLRAVQRLSEAGIAVGVNCMPVLPGITDRPDALESLVQQVAKAGAGSISAAALRLRAASRRRYLPVIREGWPELASRYEHTYHKSAYASESYRVGLQQFMRRLCKKYGISTKVYRDEDLEGTQDALEQANPNAMAGASVTSARTSAQLGLELH
ncbi:MAG: radical SAM protein [Gemmatimonas sp.]